MNNRLRLTSADTITIRRALNDAMDWQDGLADAWRRTGPEAEAAANWVRKFEALHVRLFGVPSQRQQVIERLNGAARVNIHDLGKGTNDGSS